MCSRCALFLRVASPTRTGESKLTERTGPSRFGISPPPRMRTPPVLALQMRKKSTEDSKVSSSGRGIEP